MKNKIIRIICALISVVCIYFSNEQHYYLAIVAILAGIVAVVGVKQIEIPKK